MVKETGQQRRQVRTNSLSTVSELKKIFSPTKVEKRPKMAMRKFLTTATQVIGETAGLTNKSPPTLTSTVRLTMKQKDNVTTEDRAEEDNINVLDTPEWLSKEVDDEIERAATQAEEEMDETSTTKRGRSGSSDESRENSPAGKKVAATTEEEIEEEVERRLEREMKSVKDTMRGAMVLMKKYVEEMATTKQELAKYRQEGMERNSETMCKAMEAVTLAEQTKAEMEGKMEGMEKRMKTVEEEMSGARKEMEKMGKVLQKRMEEMTKTAAGLTEAQEKYKEAQEERENAKMTMEAMQRAFDEMKAGSSLKVEQSRSGCALHLSGIKTLRDFWKLGREDPMEVVKSLLVESKAIYMYDRIIMLDKDRSRMEMDRAIIYFRSVQTKKDAEQCLKLTLANMKARGVSIRDVFAQERMAEVKDMVDQAKEDKAAGKIFRYRIINRWEQPVLQYLYNAGGRYEDIKGNNQTGGGAGRGRGFPRRQQYEDRRREAGGQRGGRRGAAGGEEGGQEEGGEEDQGRGRGAGARGGAGRGGYPGGYVPRGRGYGGGARQWNFYGDEEEEDEGSRSYGYM